MIQRPSNQQIAVIAASVAVVATFVYQQRRIIRMTNCLDRMIDVIHNHFDAHFQEVVDSRFAEIVEEEG